MAHSATDNLSAILWPLEREHQEVIITECECLH